MIEKRTTLHPAWRRRIALVLGASATGAMVVVPVANSQGSAPPVDPHAVQDMRVGGTRTQEAAVTTTTPPDVPVTEKAVPRVRAPRA